MQRLRAKTKVFHTVIRDLLFADDCALMAHTLEDIQELTTCFGRAAGRFGLRISLKKIEVMHQPKPGHASTKTSVSINGTKLNVVEKFCYLGSVLSQDAVIDENIVKSVAAASAALGKLQSRLWSESGINLKTKIDVYVAVVISTLLYGCESWTTYCRHFCSLDRFHMRNQRQLAHVKWATNAEVLRQCSMTGIDAMIVKSQLRWSGHIDRH